MLQDAIEVLFQTVYDDPRNLPVRLVLADALLERGDPRGELIMMQCMGTDDGAKLVAKHGNAFLGPLAPVVDLARSQFRRGFLETAAVEFKSATQAELLLAEPSWATVENLALDGAIWRVSPQMKLLHRLALFALPAVRPRVRELEVDFDGLEASLAHADAPRPPELVVHADAHGWIDPLRDFVAWQPASRWKTLEVRATVGHSYRGNVAELLADPLVERFDELRLVVSTTHPDLLGGRGLGMLLDLLGGNAQLQRFVLAGDDAFQLGLRPAGFEVAYTRLGSGAAARRTVAMATRSPSSQCELPHLFDIMFHAPTDWEIRELAIERSEAWDPSDEDVAAIRAVVAEHDSLD